MQTVTDADGDSDTASINLGTGVFQIEDDGPNAVVPTRRRTRWFWTRRVRSAPRTDGDSAPAGLATVTANFADNFAAVTDFGTDGPGSASYALVLTGANVASGLFALGANGAQAPHRANQARRADIIGTVGGVEDFRISIDPATGVVTFSQSTTSGTQHRQRRRHLDADAGERADLHVVQTVTDADGDKDTASINLARVVPDRGRRSERGCGQCDGRHAGSGRDASGGQRGGRRQLLRPAGRR